MKEKVGLGLGLGLNKRTILAPKSKNQGKGEKKPKNAIGQATQSSAKRALGLVGVPKELVNDSGPGSIKTCKPRTKLDSLSSGGIVTLDLPKGSLVTKLDLGLGLEEVANVQQHSTEQPVQTELALWPSEGILRQALMSFNYSDQDGINHKPEKETDGDELVPTEKSLSSPPHSVPLESVLPLSTTNKVSPSTTQTDSAKTHSLPRVLCLPVPVSLNQLTLTLASVPEVAVASTSNSKILTTVDESASSLPKSSFSAQPFILNELPVTSITLAEDSLPLIKDMNTFATMPITFAPPVDTKKMSIPLNNSAISLSTLKNTRPILATVPSKEGLVTLVYSTIPVSEPSMTFLPENQSIPLPPMSDIKSNRKGRLSSGARKQTKIESENQINVPLHQFSQPKSAVASSTITPVISKDDISVLTNSNVTVGGTQATTSAISHSVSHLMQSYDKTFPAVSNINLHPATSSLTTESNGTISVTTSSLIVTSAVSLVTTQPNTKRIKSIQDILDSQSNGTIYTTSLTSVPIMAIPNKLSTNNALNLSQIQSNGGLLPSTVPVITSVPSTIPNAQLHALLNNTTSSSGAGSGSPSLNALLNNAVSTPNPNSETPSLHSLLNDTVRNSGVSVLNAETTVADTSPQNSNQFFSSSVSEVSTCPSLSALHPTQDAAIYTSSNSLDSAPYAIQSPAEILSQLKAGALPTMSSSQVSSVLSALASDPSCPIEIENDNVHHEIISGQGLHLSSTSVDKVSTLTQTDDLDVSMPFPVDHQVKGDKNICLKGSSDDTMIAQVMNMLSREETPAILDVASNSKHPAVVNISHSVRITNHLTQEAQTSVSPALYIKQEMLESTNQRTSSFGKSIHNAIINIENYILGGDPGSGSPGDELVVSNTQQEHHSQKEQNISEQESQKVSGRRIENNVENAHCSEPQTVEPDIRLEMEDPNLIEKVTCFKCKFCPFLSLEKDTISKHIVQEHNVAVPASNMQPKLCCPGCHNVFYSETSLKVHLTQDHHVTEGQLAYFVQSVLKVAEVYKPSEKQKSTQNCESGNSKNSTIHIDQDECIVSQFGKKERNISSIDTHLTKQLLSNDCLKIRVRNLDKETNPSSVQAGEVDVDDCQLDSGFHHDEDTNSNGALDIDQQDSLPLDDDSLTKKIKAGVEPCEFKDVKEDLPDLIICEDPVTEPPVPTPPRKRGRPRGSRNQPPNSLKKPHSDQDSTTEKNSGYKCDIDSCAVRLKSHDNIEYHRRCHNLTGYVCPECSMDVLQWNSLISHLWRIHGIDMELYSCNQCSYKTNSYSKLANLHLLIHSEERPFLCDTCGKGFKNPKQLRNHKAIHIAKAKAKAGGCSVGDCSICGRSFSSVRLLRLHHDNVHRKLRPYLCNFCGYSASSRSTLKMHMRQHTGEKPFGCEECTYRTADHNSLRRHKMRHSGDKPYKCPHCNYACIQSSTFKAHLKGKHPGLDTGLMFSCPLCSFRSVKKDNYLAHLAEHELGMRLVLPEEGDMKKQDQNTEKGAKKLSDVNENMSLMIDITSAEPPDISDTSLTNNLQLVYDSGPTSDGVYQSSPANMTSKSRRHLKGITLPQITVVSHSLDGTDTQPCQMSEFEAEEITGDLREISHATEHREMKYKVSQEIQ